jgi:hypothetical protein
MRFVSPHRKVMLFQARQTPTRPVWSLVSSPVEAALHGPSLHERVWAWLSLHRELGGVGHLRPRFWLTPAQSSPPALCLGAGRTHQYVLVAEEERTAGGNVGGAVRAGDTVRRAAGGWTPAVHAMLAHLADKGFTGAPGPSDMTSGARRSSPSWRARPSQAAGRGRPGFTPRTPWIRSTAGCARTTRPSPTSVTRKMIFDWPVNPRPRARSNGSSKPCKNGSPPGRRHPHPTAGPARRLHRPLQRSNDLSTGQRTGN